MEEDDDDDDDDEWVREVTKGVSEATYGGTWNLIKWYVIYISYDTETCLKGTKKRFINSEFGMRISLVYLVLVMHNITQFQIKIKHPLASSEYGFTSRPRDTSTVKR
jgi:hypothetical protein